MTYYTEPVANDTTGIYEFFSYINNTATEGLFFAVIIFVIWIVAFLAVKQYSTSRAWTFASFFCAVLSIILAILNVLSSKLMYFFIIFTAIGLVWLKLEPS